MNCKDMCQLLNTPVGLCPKDIKLIRITVVCTRVRIRMRFRIRGAYRVSHPGRRGSWGRAGERGGCEMVCDDCVWEGALRLGNGKWLADRGLRLCDGVGEGVRDCERDGLCERFGDGERTRCGPLIWAPGYDIVSVFPSASRRSSTIVTCILALAPDIFMLSMFRIHTQHLNPTLQPAVQLWFHLEQATAN